MALARSLHLTNLLRKLYYWWATSSDGIVHLKLGEADGRFYIRTPEELRFFESYFLLEKAFLDALISTLRPGEVFYDVGTNVGKLAVPVAKVVGRKGQVIAFEPEERFCRQLHENLDLNGLTNVRVFKVALGEENAVGQLQVGGGSCPSMVPHRSSASGKPPGTFETVKIVQGDWLRENEKLPVPRAIKIDVEGFEYAVLRGLRRTLAEPQCELLCLEIHPKLLPPEASPEAITAFVNSLGFTCLRTYPRVDEIHVVATKGPNSH